MLHAFLDGYSAVMSTAAHFLLCHVLVSLWMKAIIFAKMSPKISQ